MADQDYEMEIEGRRLRRLSLDQDEDIALFAAPPTNDVQADFLRAQADAKRGRELDGNIWVQAVGQPDDSVTDGHGNPINFCHQTRTIRPWFPRHFEQAATSGFGVTGGSGTASATSNSLGAAKKRSLEFYSATSTAGITFEPKPKPRPRMAHSGTSFPFGSNSANNNAASSAPSQQTTTATSLFGNSNASSAPSQQTTTAPSLFGNMGSNSNNIFGQSSNPSTAPGANTASTGFKFNTTSSGSTGTTTGNIFSATNATTSSSTNLFGGTQTTSNPSGLFGGGSAPTFGSSQPKNSTSNLFGAAGATNNATQSGGGLFSNPNSTSTSQGLGGGLTGTPSQNKSLTISSTTTPQGQPPASTSLFGQPKPNENQAPGSAAPGQTKSLFGNATTGGGSLFGEVKNASQPSLFGGLSNTSSQTSSSAAQAPSAQPPSAPSATQPPTSSNTNIFSSAANPAPAANTNASSLFGGARLGSQNTTAPSSSPSLAGTAPTSNLFSGLGTQASTATSQSAATSTAAPTSSSNLFVAPAATATGPTNLFSAPSATSTSSTGLFSAPATSSATSTNLFSAQAAKPASSTNLFGTPAASSAASPNPTAAPASSGPTANTSLFGGVAPSQPASTGASLFSGVNVSQPANAAAATSSTAPSVAPAATLGAASSSTMGTSLFGAAGATAGGAATSSTTGPVAPPHSRLAQKSMDEIITMWSTSLASHQKTFKQLASQVSNWDHMLVENSSKISSLYCRCFQAERDCSEVERQLSVVEHGQSELEALLDRYEHDIDKMIEQSGTGDDGIGGVDGERERTYKTAEACSTRLTEMSHSLTDMIEEINAATSKISNNSGRGVAATNDPLSQIVRVLNSHLSQLQTIDSGATELKEKVEAAQRDQRVLSQNQGVNGGGGWLDDFGRSYLGRRL